MKSLAALCLTLSSCCTILRGRAEVEVTSTPPGATVTYGDRSGVTPCVLHVERDYDPLQFRAQLGEAVVSQEIGRSDRQPFGVYVVVFFESLLILPGIVDLITGDIFDAPSHVHADFTGPNPFLSIDRNRPSKKRVADRKARQEQKP